MFFVSVMTSIFIKHLPETAGMALGSFDVSLKEQAAQEQERPNSSLTDSMPGQIVSSSSSSEQSSPSKEDMVNSSSSSSSSRLQNEDQPEKSSDERIISSFEII